MKTTKLNKLQPVEFVSTGIPEIDLLVGGFPRGRVSEIHGMPGVGKTHLMMVCLAKLSKDYRVLYIDSENSLNITRLSDLGAVSGNIEVSTSYIVEEVVETVIEAVNSLQYDLIIVDSVASLVPRAEEMGEAGEAHVGLKARLIGQFMRKTLGPLGRTKTALVFINQMRETMEIYGLKKSTPGGHAIPFAASLRLELSTTRSARIKKGTEFVGQNITVLVTKSKVGKPWATTSFKLLY